MIALLDVGVLVALFDPAHVCHERAHQWLAANRSTGWATCAATENGLVQVLAHPGYPGTKITVDHAFDLLKRFIGSGDHHFWPGSTSLRRESRVDTSLLGGHDRVASAYLLLLAIEHGGRLVTLDRNVPREAVLQARSDQLVSLA